MAKLGAYQPTLAKVPSRDAVTELIVYHFRLNQPHLLCSLVLDSLEPTLRLTLPPFEFSVTVRARQIRADQSALVAKEN